MFGRDSIQEKAERQDDLLALSQDLKELDVELRALNDEKRYFLNVETALTFFINKKIEAKKRANQELRLEIEDQKANCVNLANVLNASIKTSLSRP